MSTRRIILSHNNYVVLKKLVESLQRSRKMGLPHVARLAEEMKDAIVTEESEIPDDVVTMHSRVSFTYAGSQQDSQAVLVFPAQAKQAHEYVSILSPLGMALIGEREGTDVEYEAPGGTYRLTINRVEHLQDVQAAPRR